MCNFIWYKESEITGYVGLTNDRLHNSHPKEKSRHESPVQREKWTLYLDVSDEWTYHTGKTNTYKQLRYVKSLKTTLIY